jgi:hypothetical protein
MQRYTDYRYRRVCGKFYAIDLDQADAIELASVLRVLPVKFARYGFHGRGVWVREAETVLRTHWDASEPYYRRNLECLTPEIGIALIKALREGGWKAKNPLPDVLRMTLLGLRDRGMTLDDIAEATGLSYNTVTYGFRRPHHARRAREAIGVVL